MQSCNLQAPAIGQNPDPKWVMAGDANDAFTPSPILPSAWYSLSGVSIMLGEGWQEVSL